MKALRLSKGITLLFLGPRHLMGWRLAPRPCRLYPRERPGTHCTGGSVGPRAVWTGAENLALPGFDPRTMQPVDSRHTD